MKKSLFQKLMIAYLLIMIISYLLVSIFLSVWFYQYYFQDKKNTLLNEGNHLKTIVTEFANGHINKTDMNIQISVIERLLKCEIKVVDPYGYEIKNGSKGIESSKINKDDLAAVRSGNEIIKTGDFKDIFSSYAIDVGLPVKVSSSVTYSVFIYSTLDEVKKTLATVYFVIWMSAFFAITISSFIVFYFSEKILIYPLSKINNTARKISKGEFDNRVDIVSNDEIGELAATFNYMADYVQNLEDMRKSFIANVSHELRSPMTSIHGFVEGMLDGTIDKEKWEKYLKVVDGESVRLIRMINDLLDLAKLESGEFSLQIGSFEINDLISESIIKFEDRIYEKNINMVVSLIKKRVVVNGDRDRINQVITNLVDNAIKFVSNNGTIHVTAVPKNDKVLISVFNSGQPIPKEEIGLIWDRFHKVDKARRRIHGGVGLGLSIVRQILNQHNETIWVESNLDGNTFTFTLSIYKN